MLQEVAPLPPKLQRPFQTVEIRERLVREPNWVKASQVLANPPLAFTAEQIKLLMHLFRNLFTPERLEHVFDYRALVCMALVLHYGPDSTFKAWHMFFARLREFFDRTDLDRVRRDGRALTSEYLRRLR
jgi:hypothetical protein